MRNLRSILLLTLLALLSSCSRESDAIPTPAPQLNQAEIHDLLFLYEEEKMARDLYLYGLEEHGTNQFNNISSSEQTHMDAVADLLKEYQVDIELVTDRGRFTVDAIITLYDDLLVNMKTSEIEAFNTAAFVEETDIMDIREIKARFDDAAIVKVLDQLECGSGNHMRAFNKRLEMLGAVYAPQAMPQSEFDEIIAQGHAHCGT